MPSFTLCQRCGKTICPDCRVNSPVGVLCKECVRDAQPRTSQRVARSARATGRRVASTDAPVVTYGIMIVSALVFAAQLISRYFGDGAVTALLWYAPLYSLPPEIFSFEPWRMVTMMFTHSTGFLLHILFNMYALWLFGRNLEQVLGRVTFALLYLFAGIGGGLGVMFWVYADPTSINVPTVGASGAIFGVLAATLVALRAARANITSLAVLIAINFGIGLLPGASISWQAHLGGMVVGALTTWALLATRGPRLRSRRILALVGIGAVLVLLTFAYFFVLPLSAA